MFVVFAEPKHFEEASNRILPTARRGRPGVAADPAAEAEGRGRGQTRRDGASATYERNLLGWLET